MTSLSSEPAAKRKADTQENKPAKAKKPRAPTKIDGVSAADFQATKVATLRPAMTKMCREYHKLVCNPDVLAYGRTNGRTDGRDGRADRQTDSEEGTPNACRRSCACRTSTSRRRRSPRCGRR
eukprot:TRINITY_DN333_c2_g1_i2.p3 TRINITY_DN333_c2_g1~~TRINITY_DN333_c2_g1_i2.p3  ORF type:complete len:123 (-),score=8.47 TRINITY_DN333_c2_g1_i2:772-1140(-)